MTATIIYTSKNGGFRVIQRNGSFYPQYWHHDRRAWLSFRNRVSGYDIACGSLEDAKTYEGRKQS